MSVTIAEKRTAFRELHRSGCFVLPNAWDIGSARYLASLGFKAIASTSAGFAFSRGVADNAVGLDAVLQHLRELVSASDLRRAVDAAKVRGKSVVPLRINLAAGTINNVRVAFEVAALK